MRNQFCGLAGRNALITTAMRDAHRQVSRQSLDSMLAAWLAGFSQFWKYIRCALKGMAAIKRRAKLGRHPSVFLGTSG